MTKVKHPETEKVKRVKRAKAEVEDEGGIAILVIGAAAIGLWAWLRSRKAQPELTAFAFLPRGQGQRQPAATSLAQLPRRDPTSRPDKDYAGPAFGFVF